MNPFEEGNFIQPMGSAIMLSGCLGFFPFKFWVEGWEVGGWRGGFFFKLYLVRRVDCPVDTGLFMQVLLGAGGEDLFSFQPIGGAKVPCFYSF